MSLAEPGNPPGGGMLRETTAPRQARSASSVALMTSRPFANRRALPGLTAAAGAIGLSHAVFLQELEPDLADGRERRNGVP